MKKPNVKLILMLSLAGLAVVIACMPTSVTVYDLTCGKVAYCSYLTMLEGISGAIALPFAVFCAGVSLMLAGIYAAVKKKGLLTAVKILSMVGAILAVLPILLNNAEVRVVSNVLVPSVMLAEYVAANYLAKDGTEQREEPQGRRLG